jgi:hypothetical protein
LGPIPNPQSPFNKDKNLANIYFYKLNNYFNN